MDGAEKARKGRNAASTLSSKVTLNLGLLIRDVPTTFAGIKVSRNRPQEDREYVLYFRLCRGLDC
jgi:hypothetical protein